jgi:hypothetical protein
MAEIPGLGCRFYLAACSSVPHFGRETKGYSLTACLQVTTSPEDGWQPVSLLPLLHTFASTDEFSGCSQPWGGQFGIPEDPNLEVNLASRRD